MTSTTISKDQMRAYRANSPAEVKLEVVDVPKIGPQDVLIKVASAALSAGIFRLLAQGRHPLLPTTLGHEIAGEVVGIGPMVQSIKKGQRVRVHPNTSCGVCKFCTTGRDQMCHEAAIIGFTGFGAGRMPLFEEYHPGGLADYMRAPYWLVDVLPDNVGFDVGAKVHDLANAVRVLKVAELAEGSTVVITAPTGTMGTACLKIAKFFSIGHLILVGRSTERLEAVKKLTEVKCDVVGLDTLGDDWVKTKGLVRRLRTLVPEGVDSIIDFTPEGTDMYQIAFALATHGSLVHMGGNAAPFPLPLVLTMANCWRIIGTRNHSRSDAKTVLQWLQKGWLEVDDLITHRFSLDQIDEAVAALKDRSKPVWMLVVNP